jgi:hypothetical protein
MTVNFFLKCIQDAQPRVQSKSRSWNGHKDFYLGRGWSSAGVESASCTVSLRCQQRATFMSWRQTK